MLEVKNPGVEFTTETGKTISFNEFNELELLKALEKRLLFRFSNTANQTAEDALSHIISATHILGGKADEPKNS